MEKLRTIIVPTNKEAMEELNCGIEYDKVTPDDYILWFLSEKEFSILYESGVFENINIECNAMIDDYEDELIEFEKLLDMKKAIGKYNRLTLIEIKRLEELTELALNYRTCVDFAF